MQFSPTPSCGGKALKTTVKYVMYFYIRTVICYIYIYSTHESFCKVVSFRLFPPVPVHFHTITKYDYQWNNDNQSRVMTKKLS